MMIKKFFANYDNVKAPSGAVEETLRRVTETDVFKEDAHSITSRKKGFTALASLAACLVLVFVAISAFNAFGNFSNTSHDFFITVNAAEVDMEAVNQTSIKLYVGQNSHGRGKYIYETENNLPLSYFFDYSLSDLEVQGQGIEKVTFSSNTDGIYFGISPTGNIAMIDEDKSTEMVSEKANYYSSYPLTNSKYTNEILCQGDKIGFANVYADAFSYNNLDNADIINLGSCIEIILETEDTDERVSTFLSRITEIDNQILEIRKSYTGTSGKISDEENKLNAEKERLTNEIQEILLKDAQVDVTVEFVDGTEQTKNFDLGLEIIEDTPTPWLVLTEIK